MKSEREAEIVLWDWLKTKGSCVKQVYFNSKNELGWTVFNVKGCMRKPDFVIRIDRGYGDEYIAVEIKVGDSAKDIHDAGKIMDYYLNYVSGMTRYYIGEEEIPIKHFVVATRNSPLGKLFPDDNEIKDNSESSQCKYGLEPNKEYVRTRDYLRGLWASWRRSCKPNLKEIKPSIGILISNPATNDIPYLFCQMWIDWIHNKKPQWGIRFIQL